MRPLLFMSLATVLFSKSAYAVGLSSLSEGDLLVSEVFPYPAAVSYNRGQWFEVYNNSGSAVELGGLVVTNGDGETFTVGSIVSVAAGDYALFAVRASSSINGGLTGIDYVYSFSDLSLLVSGDSLTISHGGTTFDTVTYDTAYPQPYGSSLSLSPSLHDATTTPSAAGAPPPRPSATATTAPLAVPTTAARRGSPCCLLAT
jgi:hypothetical protein